MLCHAFAAAVLRCLWIFLHLNLVFRRWNAARSGLGRFQPEYRRMFHFLLVCNQLCCVWLNLSWQFIPVHSRIHASVFCRIKKPMATRWMSTPSHHLHIFYRCRSSLSLSVFLLVILAQVDHSDNSLKNEYILDILWMLGHSQLLNTPFGSVPCILFLLWLKFV